MVAIQDDTCQPADACLYYENSVGIPISIPLARHRSYAPCADQGLFHPLGLIAEYLFSAQ